MEQEGRRPCVVVQADFADAANLGSVTIVAMSTDSHGDDALHVHVDPSPLNGLCQPGVVKCEQILTASVERLETYSGILEPRYVARVDHALKMILALR